MILISPELTWEVPKAAGIPIKTTFKRTSDKRRQWGQQSETSVKW